MDGSEQKHINQPRSPAIVPWVRDVLLFVSGLVGIGHETLISETAEPTLIVLFAAMVGLPAFLRKDESSK